MVLFVRSSIMVYRSCIGNTMISLSISHGSQVKAEQDIWDTAWEMKMMK